MEHRASALLLCILGLAACSESNDDAPSSGGNAGTAQGGSAGEAPSSGGGGTGGIGGQHFNQCGVAAPLPADNGQCATVSAPMLTDFDDYAGSDPSAYTYYVNGPPPAAGSVQGGILHVGDGSDMDGGTSVIATEMVTGEGDAGYALQISNTNAVNWGGLVMFYFPFDGAGTCLDAQDYAGVEFAIKGSSPSGKFGVNVGMLDTTPTADGGLCDNAVASDCKNATIELELADDPETWAQIRLPWSAFTPGVGSGLACVPLTGQNIQRLVIQPFMSYPPPDFVLQPGPYAIAIDNIRFFQ